MINFVPVLYLVSYQPCMYAYSYNLPHIAKGILKQHLIVLPGYFMSLQSSSREGEGLEPSDLVRYSRLYRSALHECVLGLRTMVSGEYLQVAAGTWCIK